MKCSAFAAQNGYCILQCTSFPSKCSLTMKHDGLVGGNTIYVCKLSHLICIINDISFLLAEFYCFCYFELLSLNVTLTTKCDSTC